MRYSELERHADEAGHEDVPALKKRIPWLWRLGSNRELNKLVDALHEDEIVVGIATGRYVKGRGLIVLTDSRLLFSYDGWTSTASEDLALDHVSSIEWSKKWFRGRITVHATGNSQDIKGVYYGGRELVRQARTGIRRAKTQKAHPQKNQTTRQALLGLLSRLMEEGHIPYSVFDAERKKITN